MRVGQAGDRDLVGLERDPPRERVGPRLEVDLGAGEGDPAGADPDRLDPAEPGSPGQRRDPARDEGVERHRPRLGAIGRVGWPGRAVARSPADRSSSSSAPLGSSRSCQVGRSAPSAAAIGSTVCGSAAYCASEARSGPRTTTDATPDTSTTRATVTRTHVVPTRSEIGPTMMIGRKLATETSMFRTPNTRPRTSSGRSSWSWVCDGMATKAVGDARDEGDDHDDREQRGDARQVEAARAVGALEEPADRARRPTAAASSIPSAIRPPSMTRRRGQVVAVRVEQQDARSRSRSRAAGPPPRSPWPRARASRWAKSGPRTPSTPTSDAVIPRYSSDQPIDRLERMNDEPLAQLGERRAHRVLGLGDAQAVDVVVLRAAATTAA